MTQTSVLFDVPGPRARARNAALGVATIVVVLGLVGFLVYRLFATGQFDASKWEIFGYQGIWQRILSGLVSTLAAFALAAIGALALGFVLAIARMSDHRAIRVPAAVITEVLRAVPVLVFMLLLYYALPVIDIRFTPFQAVVIALVAYNGSVLAEVIRAGVESLPNGQKEAGYAIGLRKSGVMQLILLPQAIRAMLPVIIAQLVVALKDTALGFIITYQELLYVARQLGTAATYDRPIIPATIVIGAIYIALCLLLSYIAIVVERRVSKGPRATPRQKGAAGGDTSTTKLIAIQGQQQGGAPTT
ncbi:amino acid ABC transporter permease [Agrococcus sp. SGAir0287]|uniref:amino acid ABC transporter permease n=1 Tax=Agrococcus sp. SGAir0287 TaxID=2070347 RepID=UPI001585EE6D|nr:amino acid ABC transporter permease [Agrococcus sp. SGAir0287]